MRATAAHGNRNVVYRSRQGAIRKRNHTRRQARIDVQAEQTTNPQRLQCSGSDDRPRSVTIFLGRLEQQVNSTGELIAMFGEHARGAQKRRGVEVMPAGVHETVGARVGQTTFLANGQRVNIGTQGNCRPTHPAAHACKSTGWKVEIK